jgi:hypothetical protein
VNIKVARFLFFCVCVVLAALLLVRAISIVVSGAVFAVALVVFGGAFGGFRRRGGSTRRLRLPG